MTYDVIDGKDENVGIFVDAIASETNKNMTKYIIYVSMRSWLFSCQYVYYTTHS